MSNREIQLEDRTIFDRELAHAIGGRYVRLDQNRELEEEFYDIQQKDSVRRGGLRPIQEFPALFNIGRDIVKVLQGEGIDADLLDARLNRISMGNQPDKKTLVHLDGAHRSLAEFCIGNGAIYASEDIATPMVKYVYSHELTHGLSPSGCLYLSSGRIMPTGSGVNHRTALNGEYIPSILRGSLHDINEGLVDTYAVKGLGREPMELFQSGKRVRYAAEVMTLERVARIEPGVYREMVQAEFGHGVESRAQAETFVEAYQRAAFLPRSVG